MSLRNTNLLSEQLTLDDDLSSESKKYVDQFLEDKQREYKSISLEELTKAKHYLQTYSSSPNVFSFVISFYKYKFPLLTQEQQASLNELVIATVFGIHEDNKLLGMALLTDHSQPAITDFYKKNYAKLNFRQQMAFNRLIVVMGLGVTNLQLQNSLIFEGIKGIQQRIKKLEGGRVEVSHSLGIRPEEKKMALPNLNLERTYSTLASSDDMMFHEIQKIVGGFLKEVKKEITTAKAKLPSAAQSFYSTDQKLFNKVKSGIHLAVIDNIPERAELQNICYKNLTIAIKKLFFIENLLEAKNLNDFRTVFFKESFKEAREHLAHSWIKQLVKVDPHVDPTQSKTNGQPSMPNPNRRNSIALDNPRQYILHKTIRKKIPEKKEIAKKHKINSHYKTLPLPGAANKPPSYAENKKITYYLFGGKHRRTLDQSYQHLRVDLQSKISFKEIALLSAEEKLIYLKYLILRDNLISAKVDDSDSRLTKKLDKYITAGKINEIYKSMDLILSIKKIDIQTVNRFKKELFKIQMKPEIESKSSAQSLAKNIKNLILQQKWDISIGGEKIQDDQHKVVNLVSKHQKHILSIIDTIEHEQSPINVGAIETQFGINLLPLREKQHLDWDDFVSILRAIIHSVQNSNAGLSWFRKKLRSDSVQLFYDACHDVLIEFEQSVSHKLSGPTHENYSSLRGASRRSNPDGLA